MKNLTVILVFLFTAITWYSNAQNQNNIWYFGNKAGVDFNITPPMPLISDLFTLEGTASLCDPSGNLLFYTNGATVWDRNHTIMPNGTSLSGGESSTQAALIVPLPNSCDLYYVFTTEDHYTNGGLSYSVVDMCLNNGNGDIISSTKNTLVMDITAEKITAVLHPNEVDIWIITHRLNSDEFLAYLLTETGLNTSPVISSIGSFYPSTGHIGPAKASHDGTKIVSAATFHNICEIFDFDSSTGIISNYYDINQLFSEPRFVYGMEFSSNDSLLYLSTTFVTNYLYQLDLESKALITLNSQPGNYHFGALQMGPDKKIYMARNDSSFLDVIHKPNIAGNGCQYVQKGLLLASGSVSTLGLPNFVPYSILSTSNTILSLGNDTTICEGNILYLHPEIPLNCQVTFQWNDGSTEPDKVINTPGLYWAEVQSECSIFRDSIQISFVSCSSGCESNGIAYGSPDENEQGYCLIATPENDGVYVGGTKEDSILLLKVDLNGGVVWSRSFDLFADQGEFPYCIVVDSDGMIVLSGTTDELSVGGIIYVLRYDPYNHQVLWENEYESIPNSVHGAILQKGSGGNYVMTNDLNNFADNHIDVELLEIDKNTGAVVPAISKKFRLSNRESLFEIIYDGNFIYGTGRYSDGEGIENFRNTVVKLNPDDGSQVWVKMGHIQSGEIARLYGAHLLVDQDVIISGSYGDPVGTSVLNTKFYLQKTSLDGELIWIKQYNISETNAYGYGIIKSANGYIVLSGRTLPDQELVMFEIDHDGEVLWAKKFEYSGIIDQAIINPTIGVRGHTKIVEAGGKLFFVAYGVSGLGETDLLVVRTDLNGEVDMPCIRSHDFVLEVEEIENPAFFAVLPTDSVVNPVVTAKSPQGIEYLISPREGCSMADIIFFTLDVIICEGEMFEGYGIPGMYRDTFEIGIACDSIRVLNLIVLSCLSIVHYDLEACEAYMHNGTNMDYSEFIPSFPNELTCAEVTADYLFRDPTPENKHSCTPGVNNSTAMCIGAHSGCTYVAGYEASLVIEVTIDPAADSVAWFTGLEFYEKAPATYVWIDGPTGPNNYPLRYGIRILKNGTEIFRDENIATSLSWTLQTFDFVSNDLFRVDESTLFRIELLPYCPVGNGADVSAWDVDEIKIFGGCIPVIEDQPIIHGYVMTKKDQPLENVHVLIDNSDSFINPDFDATDNTGYYILQNLDRKSNYLLKGYNNDNVLNGVSTLDLLLIQKHLLGKEVFISLDQFVAADINHSGKVSAIDLLDLRKVLLGINDEFPRNTSWRFGLLPQDLSGTNLETFEEIKSVNGFEGDYMEVNFVGIKVGDLNGDGVLNSANPKISNRESQDIVINVEEIVSGTDNLTKLVFKAGTNATIKGMQFAMSIPYHDLIGVNEAKLSLTKENVSLNENGTLRLSWNQEKESRISVGDILFTLTLNPRTSGSISSETVDLPELLRPEAYSGEELHVLPIKFNFKNSSLTVTDENYFRVEPNPVLNEANIRFYLTTGGEALINFYDISGRLIYSIHDMYKPGEHIENIKRSDLKMAKGIIYCQIICNGFSAVQKLVLAE